MNKTLVIFGLLLCYWSKVKTLNCANPIHIVVFGTCTIKNILLLVAIGITLLVSIEQVNAQVYFDPPTTSFTTGNGPSSVITADFNGDGNKDLATANNSTNNVSVLLGTGTGSFGAATNFGVGTGPYVVTSADFNGDSKADLAACNGSSNNVSVLLGNGTGSFSAATNFATGTGPRSVTSGDFNGDGNIDLATANYGSVNLSVLLGNGTGSFGAPSNFGAGTSPRSVISTDFNGDSIPDLAVSNEGSNNVSVLIGTGTGNFGAAINFSVGTQPRSLITADFNGDGNKDLATANASNNVSVLIGNGTGGFGAATNFAAGTTLWSVTAADFNTDGNIDLAVADMTPNNFSNISVLMGSGNGSFGAALSFPSTVWTIPANPASLISGDFNGDSRPDLVIANNAYNSLSVLKSFIPVVNSCAEPFRIVILGASTSFGFGASVLDSGYAYRFRQFIIDSVNGFSEIINLAHAGYTTYAMQPTGYPAPGAYPVDTLRNITKAISLDPDGVIFNFTTNDINALFPLDTTIANFLRATNMLDSLGIRYWVTTTQPRNFTGDPPATIAQKKQMILDLRDSIMMIYPLNYVESYVGFADVNGDILPQYDSGDHTHFNNAGHHLLFNNLKDKDIHLILSCSTPTNISPSNITSTKATITWAGCDCASKYRIQYRVQGTTGWTTTKVTAPISTKTLKQLLNNTTYEYRLRTECNSQGSFSSAYSSIQTFTTLCDCAKPIGITASSITQTSASVNWIGTSCAYQYRLQYRIQGTASWTTNLILAPVVTKTLTGLAANTVYEYRMRTDCNSAGTVNSRYTTIQTLTTAMRIRDNEGAASTMFVTPNPCNICELIGKADPGEIIIFDILGRKVAATLTKSSNGYYIRLPETGKGIFFIQNNRTGEVVKFAKE